MGRKYGNQLLADGRRGCDNFQGAPGTRHQRLGQDFPSDWHRKQQAVLRRQAVLRPLIRPHVPRYLRTEPHRRKILNMLGKCGYRRACYAARS